MSASQLSPIRPCRAWPLPHTFLSLGSSRPSVTPPSIPSLSSVLHRTRLQKRSHEGEGGETLRTSYIAATLTVHQTRGWDRLQGFDERTAICRLHIGQHSVLLLLLNISVSPLHPSILIVTDHATVRTKQSPVWRNFLSHWFWDSVTSLVQGLYKTVSSFQLHTIGVYTAIFSLPLSIRSTIFRSYILI